MNRVPIREMIQRYAQFLIGLFIASMGVAFSAKAGLRTSPVASVPYSVSLVSPRLSFGAWLNLLSVIQIITQVAVLKGKCNYLEIGIQTILAFINDSFRSHLRHTDCFYSLFPDVCSVCGQMRNIIVGLRLSGKLKMLTK